MNRLGILVCLCGLSLACSSPDQAASEHGRGGTAAGDTTGGPVTGGRIVIGVQQEPEILSEILNSMATNNMVCNLIFSKFVKYNDHYELVPDLIKEIPTEENGGVSPDHLMYTYHLRENARWHDGQPVTSRDVGLPSRSSWIRASTWSRARAGTW